MAVQTIIDPRNQTVNVEVTPGNTIAFDFDITNANFERTGNDLTISTEDGGTLVLTDFFVGGADGSLPALVLEDGTQVASAEIFAVLAPDMDLTPATEAAVASSGINAYSDAAGNLIAGIALSEDLDPFFWSSEAGRSEEYTGISALAAAPGGGTPPPPPPPANENYNARAVLYSKDGAPDSINFRLPSGKDSTEIVDYISYNEQNGGQSLVDLSGGLAGLPGYPGAYTLPTVPGDPAANAYDYITIIYADGSYDIIQVIVNPDGSYDSVAEDAANPTKNPNGITGEWHTQNSSTAPDIGAANNNLGADNGRYTSAKGDEMWLKGVMSTGNSTYEIQKGEGADKIYIENSVGAAAGGTTIISTGVTPGDMISIGDNVYSLAGGTVDLVSGDITVNSSTGTAALNAFGGDNTLIAGAADSFGTVNIDMTPAPGDHERLHATGMKADGGGTNSITANEVNINADASERSIGMHANNGDNTIQAHSGAAVTVTITADQGSLEHFAMYAANNGINLIQGDLAGAYDDVITINGDIKAVSGGENQILTGDGNDTVTINGEITAENPWHNIIETGEGDDTVTLNGKIHSPDALLLNMGDGHDTLILMAKDADQFNDYYKNWLQDPNNSFDNMSVESLDIRLVDSLDLGKLDWLKDVPGFDGIDSIFQVENGSTSVDVIGSFYDNGEITPDGYNYHPDGGGDFTATGDVVPGGSDIILGTDGMDTLNIDGLTINGSSDFNLSDIAGILDGFEHLAMEGGEGNNLVIDIDSLLSGGLGSLAHVEASKVGNDVNDILSLDCTNVLRISGDANDSVTITDASGWKPIANMDVTYEGVTYDVYRNDLSPIEGQFLLIQQGLIS